MKKVDFTIFFDADNDHYYESGRIISLLEDILGKKIDDIKRVIIDTKINVTSEKIEEYLDLEFEKNDLELKKEISNIDSKISKKKYGWTKQDAVYYSQLLIVKSRASKYRFEPYTLEYFKKYSEIVRKKALLLLNIIENIGNKDSDKIKDILGDIDIQLDQDGKILRSDIIRILTPMIYNFYELIDKVSDANNVETYLNLKLSLNSLYKYGWSEEEIYPSEKLQIKSLDYDNISGCISLSERQREELLEEENEYSKKLFNFSKGF